MLNRALLYLRLSHHLSELDSLRFAEESLSFAIYDFQRLKKECSSSSTVGRLDIIWRAAADRFEYY